AFFFVPFAFIQVQGYPATLAGAAFLPFTIIMAGLSRWAGGLLDRFGARLPLVIGPTVVSLGLGLMALTIARGSYLLFLVTNVIIGFGMGICVGPLKTAVINALPQHQTGVASGINNAVASVANLLAVAILGAVALGVLNHSLNRYLQNEDLSPSVRHAIDATRGKFVIGPPVLNIQGSERELAETIIKESLA